MLPPSFASWLTPTVRPKLGKQAVNEAQAAGKNPTRVDHHRARTIRGLLIKSSIVVRGIFTMQDDAKIAMPWSI